jgi:transcriptional regulator with XRE-family HTH domain
LTLDAVEDLPKTLIRARIAAGMTQEGLARRLGVKPQQIQRYEATEYESASFARIRKVVQALGLRMAKPARMLRN